MENSRFGGGNIWRNWLYLFEDFCISFLAAILVISRLINQLEKDDKSEFRQSVEGSKPIGERLSWERRQSCGVFILPTGAVQPGRV